VIPATDAELAGHADKLDVKLQSLCGNDFSLLCAFLPSLTTLESNYQKFAKTKMEYISLPSNLNGIIGKTSNYCVILIIIILHDAIKTIKNRVFPFSLKRTKSCFFFKTQKKRCFF